MHAMSQLDDALCGERNYEVRARNLFRHGTTHGPPAPLTSDATTFEALSSLQIAKGAKGTAGAEAVAASCLRHPSALVRSAACRSGLLSPEAAKTVLLSPSTSLELRRLIVRECLQLPVDAATLDAANELDDNGSPHDRSHAWRLLQRTTDEAFLREYLQSSGKAVKIGMGFSPSLAKRFPLAVFQAACNEFEQRRVWQLSPSFMEAHGSWFMEVACQRPREVLEYILTSPRMSLYSYREGEVVKRLESDHGLTILPWAWRVHPDIVVDILTSASTLVKGVTPLGVLKVHYERKGRGYHMGSVLRAVTLVFERVGKPAELASYLSLLPRCMDERRSKHCALVLDAFWAMLSRANAVPSWTTHFKCLATENKLPGAVLAREFLARSSDPKLLAQSALQKGSARDTLETYTFVLGLRGLDDALRNRVFVAFLHHEHCDGALAVDLFRALLPRAEAATSACAAFDELAKALGNAVVSAVLLEAVVRADALEQFARPQPDGVDGLPIAWVKIALSGGLLAVAPGSSTVGAAGEPCAAYQTATLLGMASDPALLTGLCTSFGRRFFWRLLATTLQHGQEQCGGGGEPARASAVPTLPRVLPTKLLERLAAIKPVRGQEPSAAATAKTATTASGTPALPPRYASEHVKAKADCSHKDAFQRELAYRNLIGLAERETPTDRRAIFADLAPFLVKKVMGEQEDTKVRRKRLSPGRRLPASPCRATCALSPFAACVRNRRHSTAHV